MLQDLAGSRQPLKQTPGHLNPAVTFHQPSRFLAHVHYKPWDHSHTCISTPPHEESFPLSPRQIREGKHDKFLLVIPESLLYKAVHNITHKPCKTEIHLNCTDSGPNNDSTMSTPANPSPLWSFTYLHIHPRHEWSSCFSLGQVR